MGHENKEAPPPLELWKSLSQQPCLCKNLASSLQKHLRVLTAQVELCSWADVLRKIQCTIPYTHSTCKRKNTQGEKDTFFSLKRFRETVFSETFRLCPVQGLAAPFFFHASRTSVPTQRRDTIKAQWLRAEMLRVRGWQCEIIFLVSNA